MSYQTMLVHADQSPSAAARMELAIRLAHACRAHLTGLACTGVSRYAELENMGPPGPLIEAELQRWREQAQASLATLAALARDRASSAPTLLLLEDDAEDGLMQHAPFNDLLILGQTDPHYHAPGVIRDLPQYLLLHSGRPLLLVPYGSGADCSAPFHHPLLAWDGSRQATRAISDALPLLKLANTVTLLILNPDPQQGREAQEPGVDMALYLARHGVRVNVMREHTTVDTGSALLCVAAELHCDLLVMGGYGHRRAREIVLGGATRTVLADMNLPVLIAH
ncbi:Nucleotide-binding universal stress protein, UspA family [Duganella sp. CF402]|uniref:universal stress protein n=1 Tax=unclassified Duganella TaxID=2636909 RepID=UPI0008D67C49|nr:MULTISPECIES: universal stress protein [unclassified Duganella]RZT11041.1 nucleotide-binding universal stress UspA family protein [Duganella sp. BK701]SEK84329.1 Nucleotide-binding universal stress protein, UspA family [Duganella sp. CF402]